LDLPRPGNVPDDRGDGRTSPYNSPMNKEIEPIDESDVVLFDGRCGLCLGSIRFLLRCDANASYRFAWLQSRAARRLLSGSEIPLPDSVVLLRNGQLFFRSTAILKALSGLGGFWKLAGIFLVIPAGVRDAIYDFVGARRYRWFGQSEKCELPSQASADRFLADGRQVEESTDALIRSGPDSL
jgi:predicted DCC family thiol-disulfide oxidoreductase YuxK